MLLRRVLPALVAAAVLAGCPSVENSNPGDKIAVATFDTTTGTIPTPNDLALQRAPAQTGLQQQLLMSFVANGGWPADQEVAVSIPVAIKTRQADGSYGAPAAPQAVDLATVNDDSVAFVRIDTNPASRVLRCPTSGAPTATCWEPSYANGVLSLRRNGPDGSRRWDAGARYVVALRDTIVADGVRLNADQAVALIAPNKNLSSVETWPPGASAASMAQLEQLRGLYANGKFWTTVANQPTCAGAGVPVAPCWLPLPAGTGGLPAIPAAFDAVNQVFPTAQMASIQSFVIQSATAVRPITDSGSGQVPLPSDFLLDPATGKVRNIPAFGPAAAGLATLDGFSTTAPLLIPITGPVKAATITKDTLRIYKITGTGPVQLRDLTALAQGQAPQIVTQPPTTVANGAATTLVLAPAVPVQLPASQGGSFVPVPPLDEKSQYLVVVTNGVQDMNDKAMKRSTLMDLVFTFTAPLCDPATDLAHCTSKVPGVSNADAAGLQNLRNQLGPVLDALSLRSCANNATCAVLAYTVKTQSVKDVSKLLAAAPYGIEQTATRAVFSPAGTADFSLAPFGLPTDPAQFAAVFPHVAKFVQAMVPTLNAIQGTTGAFDPAFATWGAAEVQQHLQPIPVLVAIPKCAAPPCVAPLVVFQHGINGSRYQMIPVADQLAAKGFVVAAIDAPYHGDRAYCTSSDQCVAPGGGAGTCTPDAALQTPSDTAAPGRCAAGNTLKIVPASLSTAASGNFFITSNFFRIRDGIRQNQLDLSVVALALARPPQAAYPLQPASNDLATALSAAGVGINPTQVYFAGISLGGMIGTSTVATNPRFVRAALNVPGGTLVDVFTQSPSFQQQLVPIFASLGIDLAKVQPGPNFDAAQAAKYAQTLAVAKWILDPAEPLNYAAAFTQKAYDPALQPFVAGGLGSATTQGYGQFITDDQVVTNPFNKELLALAGIPITEYTPTAVPAASRHGLLLANFTSPAAPVGQVIREDLASFLATTTPPPATRTIP